MFNFTLLKMPVFSKKKNDDSIPPLDPMVFYARFPHISKKIFENLNIKGLKNCRKVSKSWLKCIDNQNILWNKVAENEDCNKVLQCVIEKGHLKLTRFLIQKSAELKIDVNEKYTDLSYRTPFHLACEKGYLDIAELLIQKSAELNIDLNSQDIFGNTAFHNACKPGNS